MISYLFTFMIGGTIGFLTAALCKAAGSADRKIEEIKER